MSEWKGPSHEASELQHTAGVIAAVVTVVVVAATLQIAQLESPVAEIMLVILAVAIALAWIRIMFDPHLVRTKHGMAYVYTRPAADGEPVRVLRQGGVFQSASYLGERCFEPVFAYHRAFDAMFETGRDVRHVLALGGGGFAWPKHALAEHPDLRVDVVEIDPAIVRAARRWFFVDELAAQVGAVEGSCVAGAAQGASASSGQAARLGIIVADARTYLERPGAPCYDAIVNDTFSGREPVRRLATAEAARACKDHLVPGGLYLANVVSQRDGADLAFLRDTVATLSQVFANVQIVPALDEGLAGEDNYLVVATDGTLSLADAVPFDDDFLGSVMHDG